MKFYFNFPLVGARSLSDDFISAARRKLGVSPCRNEMKREINEAAHCELVVRR